MAKQDAPKKNNQAAEERQVPEEASPPASQGNLLGKLKLAAFVMGLVAAEGIAAYFLLPGSSSAGTMDPEELANATEPQAAVQAKAVDVPETKMDPTANLGVPGTGDEVEVDLGNFSVTSFQPTTQTTLRIDFHLWGTVGTKQSEEFLDQWGKNMNRLRDQILVIVRSAELTDLTDAGLGLIKRKILEKTNHALGKPYLRTVVFSEFSFIEQ
ncbi:MAG: flagellar basal body-associated FliL family protein [Thermogutta sp.]|nr:flagellar basal body-associated FliL family protein [Thermogutta sp.]